MPVKEATVNYPFNESGVIRIGMNMEPRQGRKEEMSAEIAMVGETAHEDARATDAQSVTDWIEQIRSFCEQEKSSTIELAKIVLAAKRKLHYGQWSQLWKCGRLPFSKRKAEMLMVIGRNLGSLDAQNSAHLPSAWNTLYYLARLERAILENLILDGIVHPGLTLKKAKEVLAKSRGAQESKARKPNLQGRFEKFRDFIQANSDSWSSKDQEWLRDELLQLADQFQSSL